MSKRNRIIYWIATGWLALGMVSTGIVQVLQLKEETEFIEKLGYPSYLIPFLGVCKILGIIVVLIPKFPLLKEWAYTGFFFMMSGAAFSHIAAGNPVKDILPCLLLIVLTALSWYFRPLNRKIVSVK
ncbi:DoxX family protein [Terrimonas sp. NA20]|uniref:DoxX family protein n=1 Tax=Terrimonas ginsenosidimutans TaxID=2908004 RepID=A0ABS9KZI0_9BACT|nr:DoxX family protein [Terrimonas ginsenosidimutans]MCG2617741.1 DoxX family protein [Terrimonas ginsenosidimutans]